MTEITSLIDSIDQFVATMTTVLPAIALIAGVVGFLMTAFFVMRVVAK